MDTEKILDKIAELSDLINKNKKDLETSMKIKSFLHANAKEEIADLVFLSLNCVELSEQLETLSSNIISKLHARESFVRECLE